MRSDRGISTVVDVALALFLITASIGIVAAYLNQQEAPEYNPKTDSRTAETLSSTTMTVQYTVEPVRDHPQFDEDAIWGSDRSDYDVNYQRSAHGTSAALIADAAVTNVRFSEDFVDSSTHGLLTKQGVDFSKAVDAGVRDTLTGTNNDTQIIAIWRPYERAPIEGRQTFGRAPPADADVSSTTMTVSCRIPTIDDDEIERQYRRDGDYEGVSELVANAIVEGYFPPEETQLALEGNGLERQLAVYRYVRMGEFVGDTFTPGNWFGAGPINGDADAHAANDQVADDLAAMIEEDMDDSEYYDDTSAEELSDRVSTGHVEIVVRTW